MYLYLIYIIRSYTIDQITAIGLGFDSHTYQEGYPWLVYQLNNQRLHVNMPEVPTNLKYIRYPNTQPYSNVIPTDYIHNVEGFCQSTEWVLSDSGNQNIHCHVASNNQGC